jgi:SAM-dependent methyltransferase
VWHKHLGSADRFHKGGVRKYLKFFPWLVTLVWAVYVFVLALEKWERKVVTFRVIVSRTGHITSVGGVSLQTPERERGDDTPSGELASHRIEYTVEGNRMAEFDDLVAEAAACASAMKGWDFSYIRGRRRSDAHPWDYSERVASMLAGVDAMMDMDTGGGEMLLSIHRRAPAWPARVVATEGYTPNVSVAARALAPVGVNVVECVASRRMPFDEASFDLIANRHGDYRAGEVLRLLRPSGVFVTQQISFGDQVQINGLLAGPSPDYERLSFDETAAEFEDAGFLIEERQDFHGRDLFFDIGALVFVLTAAPWEVPDFTVERYRNGLIELHESIQVNGPLDIGIGYILLVARKLS